MEPRKDDTEIAAALRSLRPTPRPEFAAELDARSAAGFPRASRHGGPSIGRIVERLRATTPRRLLAPAGACAVLAIAVATAVISTSQDEAVPGRHGVPLKAMSDAGAAPSPSEGAVGAAPSRASSGIGRAPAQTDSSGVQLSEVPPAGPGPYASHAARRSVERSAQIVLGADAVDVRGDAAKVLDAVHAFDGIVLHSSIRDGAEGDAGADFDLLIPSGKLGDALAAFSAIGEVRSRRESTQDITAPTVRVGEELQDVRARIESLLAQLAEASTEVERTAIETELRAERRHAAALRSRLAVLQRRANFSRVSLRIETGAPSASEGGSWGVGDGLDDAGRILAIAAGVTIVGLAVLGPFALIGLLAWLAHGLWVRRRREQALT